MRKYSVAGSFNPEVSSTRFTTVDSDAWVHLEQERQEMVSSTLPEESGDKLIDDSLVESEDDMDADADQTLKESEADAVKAGVLQEYLKGVLEQIKTEIKTSKKPQCYIQGTFWIRPRDPVFALHASSAGSFGPSPTELYHLDIFVWLPQLLPGAPDTLKCICGHKLTKHGWNDNPIARRVKCLHRDYLLLTNRFECSKPHGCGKKVQGTDPQILAQLPRCLQESFPAILTARAAVDKSLLSLMRTCFATRFGPEPFSALLAEMRYLDHAHRELLYLAAIRPLFNYTLPYPPEPFSAFGDKNRYAGTVPSKHYCKAVFVDWMRAHRPFYDRVMASLPATIVKADHTFGVSCMWSVCLKMELINLNLASQVLCPIVWCCHPSGYVHYGQ